MGIAQDTLQKRMHEHVANQYVTDRIQPLSPAGLPYFTRSGSCEKCQSTGYLGRSGIHEVLMMTDGIRSLVLKNADASALKRQAMREGMQTLRDEGACKVLAGLTTLEEVARVTQEEVE